MATNIDENKIRELLEKNIEEVSVKSELESALKSGEVLRIKLGIDPTGPKIHLGRAIPLRKLRDFQKMGHQVVLIVGDFTAQVGDASDKTEKRPMITRMQIDENLKDYKSQIGKILDLDKTEFVYNNDWLSKLTFKDVSELSECFTVQQMLARRNFKDRYEKGVEISLREFLYPIMQGYDSVAVRADVEIGGFDQLFNLKAGRAIQDYYGMKKQNIMTGVMLDGTDGRKMSTSWGNIITIVDEPNDMFGKLMSLRDDLIVKYFRLCTDEEESFILDIEQKLKEGVNPRDMKMILAEEIVTMYHNEKLATLAKNNFVETFQKGGVPDDVPEVLGADGDLFSDLALKAGAVESKTEWKRLVEDGAVSFEDGTQIKDYKEIAKSCILKIGKRRFLRVRL